MSNSCKVPEVKPIVIKRFGVSGLVPTIPTTTDCNLWSKTDLKDGELAINIRDKKLYIRADEQILEITNQASGGSSGTVTSVGLSMPSAFTVASSPITSSGTIVVTGAGTTSQYIRGDGSLDTFPTIPTVTPSALTKVDDTNVTLTLGGTPSTALLESTSITVGWTGNLAVSRGGTGAGTFTANSVLLGNSTSAFQEVAPGSSGNVLTSDGTTWVSQAPVGGGGITIGTTAIASGTVNRILFEGSGNVVQQDADFVWNNTDKRLILGTESSPDANTRLVVIGKGTGTDTTFAVHNSTGTNNSFRVRDNGRVDISFGALHIGTTTSNGKIWFGNATTPTDTNNGSLEITNGASAGSTINIPTTGSGNASTRINLRHSGIADGLRFYPSITAAGDISQYRSVFGKETGQGSSFSFGCDFRMYGTANSLTPNQGEAWRFFSANAVDVAQIAAQTLRFVIANGAAVTSSYFVNSKIGITDNSSITVDNTAVLDLQSTTRGFLPPRMTGVERDAIATPATGLTLYNTTTNTLDIKSSAASVFNRFGSETLIVGGGNTQATIALSVQNNSTNNNSFIVSDLGNIGIGTTSAGTSATKTLVINNGIAPTGDVTDSFQQYSADIVAGNAAPHFRTENGNIIKLYQETTGIAAAAFVANTSLITNDTATFGGYTIGQVVAALKAQGLLA